MEWFEESFEDVVGMDSVDICNATPGSGSPADALNWTGLHAWPFLLCTPKTLHTFLKVPGRPTSSLLLIFPAGRFPKGTTSVKKLKNGKSVKQKFTSYESEDICLVLLRNARQLPVPTKEALEELVEVLAPSILLGTWGLTQNAVRQDGGLISKFKIHWPFGYEFFDFGICDEDFLCDVWGTYLYLLLFFVADSHLL